MAALGAALARTLRDRGVAAVAAEAAVAAFRVGFEAWVASDGGRGLDYHVRAALADLRALASG